MPSDKCYRMTRQRRVITDELRKMNSHPTADQVYDAVKPILPRISLGTVYRNLEILSGMGLVKKLDFGGTQKRFDGNCAIHYHICCVRCNRIDDIPEENVTEIECIPINIQGYNIRGYKVIGVRVHFIGICEECNGSERLFTRTRFNVRRENRG